jgi:hypothetical protein
VTPCYSNGNFFEVNNSLVCNLLTTAADVNGAENGAALAHAAVRIAEAGAVAIAGAGIDALAGKRTKIILKLLFPLQIMKML